MSDDSRGEAVARVGLTLLGSWLTILLLVLALGGVSFYDAMLWALFIGGLLTAADILVGRMVPTRRFSLTLVMREISPWICACLVGIAVFFILNIGEPEDAVRFAVGLTILVTITDVVGGVVKRWRRQRERS